MANGKITATQSRPKTRTIGKTSRPIQPSQPVSCYGYCCVAYLTNGFAPKSLAELPPREDMDSVCFERDYENGDQFQMSRNVAMATVAEMNATALHDETNYKEGHPKRWHFAIKIVPALEKWRCLFSIEGDRGMIEGAQMNFEIVKPTADELEVYSVSS